MKNKTLKINTKKRNIIIAIIIAIVAIIAGISFGVYSYSKSNEIEDPAVEETVATVSDSSIEDTTEVGEVEDTETVSANSTDKPEEVVEEPTTTKPTSKPTTEDKTPTPTPTTEKPAKPTPKPKSKHTHSYTSKETTKPTCCKEGVRTYTCSCGDTYTEAIATVDHTWVTTYHEGKEIKVDHEVADDGFDFTAANYNEQQQIDYCEEHKCGSADQPVVIGHEKGYDETKCSVCGKIQ